MILLLGGLRAGEWMSVRWTARLSILMGGLLLIVPVGLGILGQGPQAGCGPTAIATRVVRL